MNSKIPRIKSPGSFSPVLPLLLVKAAAVEEEKGMYLSFEIKSKWANWLGVLLIKNLFESLKKEPLSNGLTCSRTWKKFGLKTP